MFFTKRAAVASQIKETTAKLHTAYDQLADGNRVKTVAEFHAYGDRWNVDTHALVDAANARLAQVRIEAATRQARRTKRAA